MVSDRSPAGAGWAVPWQLYVRDYSLTLSDGCDTV